MESEGILLLSSEPKNGAWEAKTPEGVNHTGKTMIRIQVVAAASEVLNPSGQAEHAVLLPT